MTKPTSRTPLTDRLEAAGLGTLRAEAQAREDAIVEAEIAELERLGYGETAQLVREKLHHAS